MPVLTYNITPRYTPWETYTAGSWKPLGGAKVLYQGAWLTLKSTDKIYKNSNWYVLGMVVSNNYIVSSGQTQADVKVIPGGSLIIYSGGTAQDIIQAGGYVSAYAEANVNFIPNTISGLSTRNAVTVHSNTIASDVDAASLQIFSGGTATDIRVSTYGGGTTQGRVRIYEGGVISRLSQAYSLQVNSGGSADVVKGVHLIQVESAGQVNSAYLTPGAYLYISSGGIASNIVLNVGGLVQIASGGTAAIAYNPYGTGSMNSARGAEVIYLQRDAQVYYGSTGGLISKGAALSDLYINAGYSATVYSQGMMSNIVVNSSGYVNISNGGTIKDVTVNQGGSVVISSGGTALNVAWAPFNGAIISIHNAATITYAGNPKGVYLGYGKSLYSSSISMVNKRLLYSMYVMDEGFIDSTIDQGELWVHSGGTANSTLVDSGGKMHVYSGGSASIISAGQSGAVYILEGGTAINIVENGGYVITHSQASAGFLSNTFTGSLATVSATVHSGTTANSVYLWRYGTLHVYSGGTARDTSITNGSLFIYYSGVANKTSVLGGGALLVSSGGTANSTVLSSGRAHISSGGSADSITVSRGCNLYIDSEGAATNIIQNGGYIDVSQGANAGFTPNIINGLTISSVMRATIHSGTVGSSITIDAWGELYISSGGVANHATVNSGGSLKIESGATAYNVTVGEDGSLFINSGGSALSVTRSPRAYISVAPGGYITYTSS